MTSENLQLVLSFFQTEAPTLDNFIAGRNIDAVNVFRELATGIGPQIVYVFGGPGVGKTHLLKSLVKNQEKVPVFDEKIKIYAVDDVQKLNDEELAGLFELINQVRAHSNTHLIVSGDRSPMSLKTSGMREDVTSRLGWGTVLEIEPLSDDDRGLLFIHRARNNGLTLSDDVINWMSTYLPRDLRTLSVLFEELDNYSLSKGRAITIPLIKEWLNKTQQTN